MQVGDLVVYRQPQFDRLKAAKRIVGMPGDYVVVDPSVKEAEQMQMTQVWKLLVFDGTGGGVGQVVDSCFSVKVPEGHIWVTGDNLPYSRDSRTYGAVPLGLVSGKIIGKAYLDSYLLPRFQWFWNPLAEPVQTL
jgi:inner membrane protease subunit 1